MSHIKQAKTRNVKALRRDNRCPNCGTYLVSSEEQKAGFCRSCSSTGQRTLLTNYTGEHNV